MNIRIIEDRQVPGIFLSSAYKSNLFPRLSPGEVTAARETLKELPEALKVAELDTKRREAWEKDIQKKTESAAKLQDFKPISR